MSPTAHPTPERPGPFVTGGLFLAVCLGVLCAVLGLTGAAISRSTPLAAAGALALVLAATVGWALWRAREWPHAIATVASLGRFAYLMTLARLEARFRRGLRDDEPI
jgi:hypothetical protein